MIRPQESVVALRLLGPVGWGIVVLALSCLPGACGERPREGEFSRLGLEQRLASLDRHDETLVGEEDRPVRRFRRLLDRLQEAYPGTAREVLAEQGVRGRQALLDSGSFEGLLDLMNATLVATRGRPTATPYAEAVTRYVEARRSGLAAPEATAALAVSLRPAPGAGLTTPAVSGPPAAPGGS
ncbi:MAG: hypothetical protein JNM82_15120 [Rhodocyclaceae bacterium]|nr:hypothetical protein [Rhodocyclaceae bacterium]